MWHLKIVTSLRISWNDCGNTITIKHRSELSYIELINGKYVQWSYKHSQIYIDRKIEEYIDRIYTYTHIQENANELFSMKVRLALEHLEF